MKCGRSNHRGIMIYDSDTSKGVFGYYDNKEIILVEGTVNELKQYFKTNKNKKSLHRIMLSSFIIECIISLFSLFHLPILTTFSIILFFILTYIRLNTIIYSFFGTYENKEDEEQFKRFHACEHKILNVKEITLENIYNASMFHIDCGTIHACNIVVFIGIFCFNLANIFHIGFIKFMVNIFLSILILIINLFNPYNPFFIVQKQVVRRPSEYEYNLALKIIEKFNVINENI